MRYIGIAAEAADEAMPPPEGLPQADIFDRLLESVSQLEAMTGSVVGLCEGRAAAVGASCTLHTLADSHNMTRLLCILTHPQRAERMEHVRAQGGMSGLVDTVSGVTVVCGCGACGLVYIFNLFVLMV